MYEQQGGGQALPGNTTAPWGVGNVTIGPITTGPAPEAAVPQKIKGLDPSGGGKLAGNHYYRVEVGNPISPELGPYVAECADIIEALGMTFNEGEAFKAIWRLAAGRQGRGKAGSSAQYDADKVAHYGARVAAHSPTLSKAADGRR